MDTSGSGTHTGVLCGMNTLKVWGGLGDEGRYEVEAMRGREERRLAVLWISAGARGLQGLSGPRKF